MIRLWLIMVIQAGLNGIGLAQQEPLAIGHWKAVLPYTTGLVVTQSADHVYYATSQSLMQIDKSDQSPRYYSRVDGLSDNGVSHMAFSQSLNTLVLGYHSGNIDLLTTSGVWNVPDIFNNLSITGDKTIYDVALVGDTLVVFSCGFGIVQFDLKERFFRKTAFTGASVIQTIFDGSYWYAATEDGIYRLPENGFFQNFPAWERIGVAQGLPLSYSVEGIALVGDDLFFGINNGLWAWDGMQALHIYTVPGSRLQFIQSSANHLFAGFIPSSGGAGSLYVRTPDGEERLLQGDCFGQPQGAIFDQGNNRIWLADEWLDFRNIGPDGQDCQRLTYNSPFHFSCSEIHILEDSVYIASGTISSNLSGTSNNSGIYVSKAGQWHNYNFFNYPQLLDWEAHIDYNTINVDPLDGTIYAGSYYGGLLRIRGNELTIFQDTNSALQGATGDPLRERVGGMARDQRGHLWIANPLAPKPLVVLTSDNQWGSFSPVSNVYVFKGIVDANNNKWFVLGSGGVLVYHDGDDVLSPSDDKFRVLNANNANLPSDKVVSLGLDLDGAVWIGTDDGVGVVRCPNVFDASCRASRIIVTQEGVTEALLNDEVVTAITVDGANRKWLGTRNGLFVQSEDGLTEVMRFTLDNSPLLDKHINALAFNAKSGEMWIGTERGIMIYQTDAPVGGEVHESEVEVYPNPVRPDYLGPIAIKGLPRDANVKITDIRGRLVYETTALGGQAIWYGNDYTGRRAASGVYLVFSTSDNSFNTPDKQVSKIVFIR